MIQPPSPKLLGAIHEEVDAVDRGVDEVHSSSIETIYHTAREGRQGASGGRFRDRPLVDFPAVLDVAHSLLERPGIAVEDLFVLAKRQHPTVLVDVLTLPNLEYRLLLALGFCRVVRSQSPCASCIHSKDVSFLLGERPRMFYLMSRR